MSAETRRLSLRYDPGLSEDSTWCLTPKQDGIVCRLRIGGIGYSGEIALRWRRLPARFAGEKRVFVAPADSDRSLWITQPAVIAEGLLPVELQLERAPLHVIETMSGW